MQLKHGHSGWPFCQINWLWLVREGLNICRLRQHRSSLFVLRAVRFTKFQNLTAFERRSDGKIIVCFSFREIRAARGHRTVPPATKIAAIATKQRFIPFTPEKGCVMFNLVCGRNVHSRFISRWERQFWVNWSSLTGLNCSHIATARNVLDL